MTEPHTEFAYTDYSHLQPSEPDDAAPLQIDGDTAPTGAPGVPPAQVPRLADAPDVLAPAPPGVRDSGHEDLPRDDGTSLADDFARDFATTHVPTTTVPIPAREGWALRFRLDWNEAKTREWKRRAADPQAERKISMTKLYRATIGDQCTAILKEVPGVEGIEWVPLTAPGGDVLVFRDPRLHRLLNVTGTEAAVHNVLPFFSQLATVGQAMATAAGQDDLLDPFDLG